MESGNVPASRVAWRRVPLLALGMTSLLAGIYGGLARLPLNLPSPADNANWLTFRGPLMVCGFLGTVIGLKRAVGLPNVWAYAAPLLTLGSALFVVVTLRVVQLQRALFTVTMSLGAMCWLTGNALWLCDWPFARIVRWWIAFLGLAIVGERLDLSRFQKPNRLRARCSSRPLRVSGR